MLGSTNAFRKLMENFSISLNGGTPLTYNGITSKSLNITASSIGAAVSNHNHDTVYAPLTHSHNYMPLDGGIMRNWINFNTDYGIMWNRNSDWARIFFKNTADSDADSYMCFRTGDNGNEYFKWDHLYSGNSVPETWMELHKNNLKVKGNIYANQTALATIDFISTEKSISSNNTKLWAY